MRRPQQGRAQRGSQPVTSLSVSILCVLLSVAPVRAANPGPEGQGLEEILQYISSGWDGLTRSMAKCESVAGARGEENIVLYLPAGFPVPAAVRTLQRNCSVRVEHLPGKIDTPGAIDVSKIQPHGLLYLENSYVVPGGMFNEMYGWDSYFIIRGLVRAGRIELARGMVENFFFEIEHYGMILNANRTYFLSRSQPPFLTSMILAVYEADRAAGREDLAWLAKAYDYAVRDYDMWTRKPHLAGETGLSRYYGLGEGVSSELTGSAVEYFGYAIRHLLRGQGSRHPYLTRASARQSLVGVAGPVFSLYLCNPNAAEPSAEDCALVENTGLSADFYAGDRSARESGYDISFRFGPFSGATHHYAAVCLNSLLYKAEKDLDWIAARLGREPEARQWRQRARIRQQKMQEYLWDDDRGLFFDYNFRTRTRSNYEYLTTFFPLWAGLASPQQTRAVVGNLPLFEQPGGLAMSRQETKLQWDYPYGWAPLHLVAVEGLRRYGYEEEANRISLTFLSTIVDNFRRDDTIREKYNVVTRSSETQTRGVYRQNVIGFGWTNGVFLELLHHLPKEGVDRLAKQ